MSPGQQRGWLTSPRDDPRARKAFRVGEWNRYRVEAAGDRLRTWVNDVPVSDLVDGMARSGFIGFQVHQAKEAGPAPGAPAANGDIVTDRACGAFELVADFRLSPGANSGIKYFVRTDVMADGGQSSVGLEYQVIDDAGNPDASQGRGTRSTAALYDVYGAAAAGSLKPMGEWNEARIVARGRHVEHWLNGTKVLEFERGSEDFKKHVAEGKHRVWPSYGEWAEGLILLQHHGGGVSYRNVKVRPLTDR